MSIDGLVVVITGAAGGIGTACAERFARDGARLELVDAKAERLAASPEPPGAAEVVRHAVDVTDAVAVTALAAAVSERFPRVDVLVNAAGVLLATPFEAITTEEWQRIM